MENTIILFCLELRPIACNNVDYSDILAFPKDRLLISKTWSFASSFTPYCASKPYFLKNNTGVFRTLTHIFCPQNPYYFLSGKRTSSYQISVSLSKILTNYTEVPSLTFVIVDAMGYHLQKSVFVVFFSIFSVYPRFLCSKMVNVHVFLLSLQPKNVSFWCFWQPGVI